MDTRSGQVLVEVEEALGPGIEFATDERGARIGIGARRGPLWLGMDRAAVLDSDDGHGGRLPILVALPGSTFRGCRLSVEVVGALVAPERLVLLGALPGGPHPVPAVACVVGRLPDARFLPREEALAAVRAARSAHRERRAHARIRSGRAWLPEGLDSPEQQRFATPHSSAEYDLVRLPPRFVRGLEALLDDDERLLYSIERPAVLDPRWGERMRRIDRRAGLLALTDRQLLAIVDHARPDRYLSDWGVDVQLIPNERVLGVAVDEDRDAVVVVVHTAAGLRSFRLPAEYGAEARVMARLVERFAASDGTLVPRRVYPTAGRPFDSAAAVAFGQTTEARGLFDEIGRSEGPVEAFVFSPVRPGHRSPAAMALHGTTVTVAHSSRRETLAIDRIASVELSLSPLVVRLGVPPGPTLALPAAAHGEATTFARAMRASLANLPGSSATGAAQRGAGARAVV